MLVQPCVWTVLCSRHVSHSQGCSTVKPEARECDNRWNRWHITVCAGGGLLGQVHLNKPGRLQFVDMPKKTWISHCCASHAHQVILIAHVERWVCNPDQMVLLPRFPKTMDDLWQNRKRFMPLCTHLRFSHVWTNLALPFSENRLLLPLWGQNLQRFDCLWTLSSPGDMVGKLRRDLGARAPMHNRKEEEGSREGIDLSLVVLLLVSFKQLYNHCFACQCVKLLMHAVPSVALLTETEMKNIQAYDKEFLKKNGVVSPRCYQTNQNAFKSFLGQSRKFISPLSIKTNPKGACTIHNGCMFFATFLLRVVFLFDVLYLKSSGSSKYPNL